MSQQKITGKFGHFVGRKSSTSTLGSHMNCAKTLNEFWNLLLRLYSLSENDHYLPHIMNHNNSITNYVLIYELLNFIGIPLLNSTITDSLHPIPT